jgi:A/G-specific adenine glycosylase
MKNKIKRVNKQKIEFFRIRLLRWFKENGRHFPWRNKSATNYEKIISEVLLQRTKAETASRFFTSFIKKYPSWKRLAKASLEELEEALHPVGLQKQRARRVFSLAQEMKKRKGRIPGDKEDINSIPMFGQYITNAIMLLVYGEPSPLLDVNMSRVLERFFGPRQMSDIRYDPYLQGLAFKIVNHPEARTINWAILDFAAAICKARQPQCSRCPIMGRCKFSRPGKKKDKG